jgi:hypothetical protein
METANANANETSAGSGKAAAPSLSEMQNQLLSMPIQSENDALTAMVSFLNLAQRRGAFSINESAKIWECIRVFQRPG